MLSDVECIISYLHKDGILQFQMGETRIGSFSFFVQKLVHLLDQQDIRHHPTLIVLHEMYILITAHVSWFITPMKTYRHNYTCCKIKYTVYCSR